MKERTELIIEKLGPLGNSVWGKRIIAASERDNYTAADAELAASWATCACGEIAADIARFTDGAPQDPVLHRLGSDFAFAVDPKYPKFVLAASLLVRIEARALELTS